MNTSLKDHGLLLLGLCLAGGMIISVSIAMRTVERIKLSHQTIRVKGFSEKAIESDFGTWTGSFSVRMPTLEAAYDELLTQRSAVRAFLASQQVPESTIEFASVSTSTIAKLDADGDKTNEIEAYVLTQSVRLATDDLPLLDKVARQSTDLLQQGVQLKSNDPQYFYSKLDEIKIELLGAAMKDAMDRAKVLAENSGATVGPLAEASQGIFQITPPHSTEVSDYGISDTSTVKKVVKAVITAEFSVR